MTRPAPARQRLLEAAARLFYANGMTATGIDAVTAEAGVAKQSLYNNFASKDELVLAYLEARHEEWLGLYRARLEAAASASAAPAAASASDSARAGEPSPRDGVLAVFDAYLDHAESAYAHGFRGCGLLNAAAELPAGAPGREAVRRHKEEVEAILLGHLESMAREGGRADADAVSTAEHLSFLLEGAMSRAGLEGASDRLVHARRLAAAILDAAA